MSNREKNRLRYTIRKYLILALVVILASSLGFYWLGLELMIWIGMLTGGLFLVMPKNSSRLLLQWRGAKIITYYNYPELYQMAVELARKAKLSSVPQMFLVPQNGINAFAISSSKQPLIGITRGLISYLDRRQLFGVLAHEISHIKNKDLSLKKFAGSVGSITNNLSMLGRILLIINLPLYLMGMETLPWIAILMLILAPALNLLLQLGLSRSMEYMADVDAAELTGDPVGLASALHKIETLQKRWFWGLGYKMPSNNWLSSHPETKLRINKLLERQHHRSPNCNFNNLRIEYTFL